MLKINWLFAKERNTEQATFQAKSIFNAFYRIQRYWSVDFQQVSSGSQLSFILTNGKKQNPAWQRGKSIYLSANYKWINHEQATLAVVHEIGHWLVNGGGHIKSPGFIMSEVIGDPYINFTEQDLKWFGKLPWASKIRPWDEPNYFRPKTYSENNVENIHLCEYNKKSLFDFMFSWPKVYNINSM